MTPLIARILSAERPPAWSLIVTIYGDAVAPRGGSLWLGTLLAVMEGLGIGGGVVRTAMSRLAADGWIDRTRLGRESFYRLAARSHADFEAATERIYFAPPHPWDGRLRIAILAEGEERPAQRATLEAIGFGTVAPGVMLGLDDAPRIAGLAALSAEAGGEESRRLAARAWPLDRIAGGYRRFIERFEAAGRPSTDLDSLLLRVLLIHQYRRILLRDPMLPDELLPPDWPGRAARDLCGRLYRSLVPGAERWLDAQGRSEHGPLPPPDARFQARFA